MNKVCLPCVPELYVKGKWLSRNDLSAFDINRQGENHFTRLIRPQPKPVNPRPVINCDNCTTKIIRPVHSDYIDTRDRKNYHPYDDIWNPSHRQCTPLNYRHNRHYLEIQPANNTLEFRLRTCYDHAKDSLVPKARFVVQPETVNGRSLKQKELYNSYSNNNLSLNHPLMIIEDRRKQHFNEAVNGQHMGTYYLISYRSTLHLILYSGTHHMSNGKNGYVRVELGRFSLD